MAIDNTGISSLDTGASDITYTGNEGPKSPQQEQQMMLAQLEQEYEQYRMEQIEIDPSKVLSFEEWYQSEYGAARQGVAYGGTARPTYTQDRKQRLANGGITQLVKPGPGRPGYGGPGSWFQEYIKDPIEMAITGKTQAEIDAESQARVDREEAGLPEGESYTPWYEQIFSPAAQQLTQQTASDFGLDSLLTGGLQQNLSVNDILNVFGLGTKHKFLDKDILPDPYLKTMTGERVAGTDDRYIPDPNDPTGQKKIFVAGSQAIPAQYETKVNPFYPIAGGMAAHEYAKAHPGPTLPAETAIGARNIDMAAAKRGDDLRFGLDPSLIKAAQGGRIGAQEGGLMNLGGMEKDYRQEGGFVPIGGQEKADDVPARLSKNEFVFTADAVRAAGGGDIDAGAEVMENVMNNLEQGGQISQESQGLEGARNMFATAQRLEGVL
jgi:hypothetical protein